MQGTKRDAKKSKTQVLHLMTLNLMGKMEVFTINSNDKGK